MRTYRYDKQGNCIETTPEKDREVAVALERDTKRIRKGLTSGRVHKTPKWPLTPEAMGVDQDQISEARDLARSKGVPTDYTPTGEPIITGPEHYRKYRRAFGYYERNSYDSPVNR